jgi:hypothetical protein
MLPVLLSLKFIFNILYYYNGICPISPTWYESWTWKYWWIMKIEKDSQSDQLYFANHICNQGKVVAPQVPSLSEHSTLAFRLFHSLFSQLTTHSAPDVVSWSLATFSPPIFLHIQILLPLELDHHQQYYKLPWKWHVQEYVKEYGEKNIRSIFS